MRSVNWGFPLGEEEAQRKEMGRGDVKATSNNPVRFKNKVQLSQYKGMLI